MPLNQKETELPDWNSLSPAEREIVTRSVLSIRKYKFALMALTALFALIQPVISSYQNSKSADRQRELAQIEKTQDAASKNIATLMESVLKSTEQIGILKGENELLKKKIAELEAIQTALKKENTDLANELKFLKNS